MKKLLLVLLIIVAVFISPGFASEATLEQFMKEVAKEEKVSGRAQVRAENAVCIILMFGLDKTMKYLKYDKVEKQIEIKEIKKFDDTPSEWDQTPSERLQEAIAIYEGTSTD